MAKKKDRRIYISVDFEGAACVTGEPGKFLRDNRDLYEEAQRIVTAEANAAVDGCLEGGATEVIVDDAHDGGICMLHDRIHPEAKVVVGPLRPRRFEPLDSSFAGMILLAYHPMAGVSRGVLSHSYSSVGIQRMWLNGREIGEIGFDAALAGELGVPVILVTSCAEGCREARDFLGDIETVVTKWGFSRNAALSLSTAKARDLIRAAARSACRRAGQIKPFKVAPPYELKTEYKLESSVDGAKPSERLDPRTTVRRADSLFDLI